MTLLQEELARQHEKLASYLEISSGIGMALIDSALNILDCNQGFMRMFQLKQKPVGAAVADYLMLGASDLKQNEELILSCSQKSGLNGILYCRAVGSESRCLLFCERLMLTESRAIEQIGVINNELINLQRESVKKNLLLVKLGRELDERVAELEATLARVKQLEGIIPICAYCKKIRDDQDGWQGLEKYFTEHSEARFSHGICPACFEEEMKKMETNREISG
jgi:hypothetical protein